MSTTTKTKGTRQIPYSEIKKLLREFVISTNKHNHDEMAKLLAQLPPKSRVCHNPVFFTIIKAGCRIEELRLAEAHGFHFMKVEWEDDTAEHISAEALSILLQEYPEYVLERQGNHYLAELFFHYNLLDHVDVASTHVDPTRYHGRCPLVGKCRSLEALELLVAYGNISAFYKSVFPERIIDKDYTVLDNLMCVWERMKELTFYHIHLGTPSSRLITQHHLATKEFLEFHQARIADEETSYKLRYRIFFSRSFTSRLLCALKTTNFHLTARRLN